MELTTCLTIFHRQLTASRVCRSSMIRYNVPVIIALMAQYVTSNFPARISDEVGKLCTVLLSVYSGKCVPIFIKIVSYLTDKEKKKSWHIFY